MYMCGGRKRKRNSNKALHNKGACSNWRVQSGESRYYITREEEEKGGKYKNVSTNQQQ